MSGIITSGFLIGSICSLIICPIEMSRIAIQVFNQFMDNN